MKRTTKTSMLVAGAAALGLAATLAIAHPGGAAGYGPGAGTGPGMMGGHGPMGMGPGMMGGHGPMGMGQHMPGMGPQAMQGADFAAVLDSRLAASKAELKITADQEPAWNAYATQVKTQYETMRTFMTTMYATPPGTAAERVEQHAAMMKQRATMAEQTSKSVKDLYAALTPEQRAIADQRLFAMGPGAGMGRGAAMGYGAGMGPGGRMR